MTKMEEDLFWEYPKLQLDIDTPLPVEGIGAYGIVHKMTYNNEIIALKKIRTSRRLLKKTPEFIKKIKREINIMEVLKDVDQIVQFIGIYMSEHYVFIAMQSAEKKSLYDYIQQTKQDLDWKYIKRFSYDVALGLSYLHDIDIYHGDIKAHNILLDSEFRAKLCDFGTSKNDEFSINVGTNNRWSPERKAGTCKPDKDDVYALGLLMVEMSLFKLYGEEFELNLIEDVSENENTPKNFLDVLTNCLDNEQNRPFAKQAVDELENITEIITTKSSSKQDRKDATLLVNIDDDEYAVFEDVKRKAFEGDISAQFTLGVYYKNGYGTQRDYEQAKAWYTKAAEAGDTKAQCNLGYYYKIEKDYEQAKQWWTKAAEAGYIDAQYALGYYYDKVEKNHEQTKLWYTKAAEAGDADAQRYLGAYYYEIENDYKQAKLWHTKAAETGDANTQNALGYYYKDIEKDYNKAKEMYLLATSQGDANAMHSFGEYYQDIEKDYDEAMRWYHKSIKAGLDNGYGEHGIGNCYYNTKDNNKAREWYMKATEKGCVEAYFNLGYISLIEADKESSFNWYLKAAENGHTESKYIIGILYQEKGDHDMAKHWLTKAAEDGDKDAKKKLQEINRQCVIS